MSNSLPSHGQQTTRLLSSWGFSRQEYWSGCHALLQRIFPTQGSNLGLLHCRQILYCWVTREVQCNDRCLYINKGQEMRGNVITEEGGESYLRILHCCLWRWRKEAWVKGHKKLISRAWKSRGSMLSSRASREKHSPTHTLVSGQWNPAVTLKDACRLEEKLWWT